MKRAILLGLAFCGVVVAQTAIQPGEYIVPAGTTVTPTGGTAIALPNGGTASVPQPAAFNTRCEELRAKMGDAIINCWDFETKEQSLLREAGNPTSEYRPGVTIDPTQAASGKSSMRFETISYNEALRRCPTCTVEQNVRTARQSNTSWWARNFKEDLSWQVGEGEEFWIQMRIKENDAFYGGPWGGSGPKKWIIGTGDRNVDFVFKIRDPLPKTAGAGTVIALVQGDNPDFLPNAGKMNIGSEPISYRGLDRAANTIIVHYRGAPVDHPAGEPATVKQHPKYAPGCTDIDFPISEAWYRFLPSSYHSCGVKDRQYEGHNLPILNPGGTGAADWIIQSGRRGTWNDTLKKWEGYCSLERIKLGDYTGCIRDLPGQGWNTFTIHVKIGKYYNNNKVYRHDSTVEVWKNADKITDLNPNNRHPRSDAPTPEECQASTRSIADASKCLTGYDIVRLPASTANASLSGPVSAQDAAQGGGKVGMVHLNMQSWRRQYLDQTDPVFANHPIIERWYDDLVVSSKPIPLPDGTVLK